MTKGPKFKNHVSPVGTAKLAFIEKPSKPFKEGDSEDYKVRVLLDDTPENREWCESVVETALAEAKQHNIKVKKVYHNPFVYPEDVDPDDYVAEPGKDRAKYDEDHQGRIFFQAKSKFKPGRIDTDRESLPDNVKIYGDDKIRVKVEAAPYANGSNTGVTLRLKTVQLVEKNASFSGGVDTEGFDEIEGYTIGGEGGDAIEDEDF
ncbi:MAG: DUF2815 family protein [Gammaproteobacteria bacterium]|nr:DUF2815 family protein [Gammaproteobacteria bacterium]